MPTPRNFYKLIVQKDEWPILLQSMRTMAQHEVQVGVFMPTVATRAWLNEYGIGDTPERPAWRKTIAERQNAWLKRVQRSLVWKGRANSPAVVLTSVGKMMRLELRRGILRYNDPRNAPATVAMKGFDEPLVKTGTYLNSIETRIVRAGGK